jgi:hypothetical protein
VELEALLDLLRAKGVTEYDGPVPGSALTSSPVRLRLTAALVPPAAPGEAVNLDEGMPALAKDPDAADEADPIVARNFPATKAT